MSWTFSSAAFSYCDLVSVWARSSSCLVSIYRHESWQLGTSDGASWNLLSILLPRLFTSESSFHCQFPAALFMSHKRILGYYDQEVKFTLNCKIPKKNYSRFPSKKKSVNSEAEITCLGLCIEVWELEKSKHWSLVFLGKLWCHSLSNFWRQKSVRGFWKHKKTVSCTRQYLRCVDHNNQQHYSIEFVCFFAFLYAFCIFL